MAVAAAAVALVAGTTVALAAPDAVASGASAAYTSTNPAVDGADNTLCLNHDNTTTNCNIYGDKSYVWLNGGPDTAYEGAGEYFFAVLAPGGQADPNDGTDHLLSTDAYANRTFSSDADGTLSYDTTLGHDFESNKIRLMDYADTPNPGGVYILAICYLPNGTQPVAPKTCKYDAFKVKSDGTVVVAPSVYKTADGAYTDTFTWDVTKSADHTSLNLTGGSAPVNYTVTVTHDAGTVSGVTVSGQIFVVNGNTDESGNVLPVTVDVADTLSDGTACTFDGTSGAGLVLDALQTVVDYSCALSVLPSGDLTNTATISWATQPVGTGTLNEGTDHWTTDPISFTENAVDDCADVSDTMAGSLGTVCVGDANPTVFNYSENLAAPAHGCTDYPNTASTLTNDSHTPDSADWTVHVCRTYLTGEGTMGFWQNKNGQALIAGANQTALLAYLKSFAPFADATAPVKTYVTNVIKAASATGSSMNAMLKGQMLATALDVYFAKIAGSNVVDLTTVCANPLACTAWIDASGPLGASALSVNQILAAASSASNAGGSVWYGQVKTTQEKVKDVFDALNNGVAYGA